MAWPRGTARLAAGQPAHPCTADRVTTRTAPIDASPPPVCLTQDLPKGAPCTTSPQTLEWLSVPVPVPVPAWASLLVRLHSSTHPPAATSRAFKTSKHHPKKRVGRLEKNDLSATQPARMASLLARLVELNRTAFQTGALLRVHSFCFRLGLPYAACVSSRN
jgi:hypothetical protein